MPKPYLGHIEEEFLAVRTQYLCIFLKHLDDLDGSAGLKISDLRIDNHTTYPYTASFKREIRCPQNQDLKTKT